MRLKDKPSIVRDIEPEEGRRLLDKGAESLGLSLSARQLDQFMDYLALLEKWNRLVNLTALHSAKEILIKHFLDSLTLLAYLPEEVRIMDLGSGAGFPGLPVKIVRPAQSITLVEASAKKVSFLREVIRRLKLGTVEVIRDYLDKGAGFAPGTDQFEIIITRAVRITKRLLGAAGGILPRGGRLVLMKGKKGLTELESLKGEIGEKGFELEKNIGLTLPFSGQERYLIFLARK